MRDRAFRTLAKIAAFATILPFSTQGFAQEHVAISPSECARLLELQIDQQANPRAGRLSVACSERPVSYAVPEEPSAEPVQGIDPGALASLIGGSDFNLITTPDNVFPTVTQAGSMTWGNGTDVVVVYTDTKDAPGSFSGMSVSTDGGINFDRLDPDPFGAVFTDDSGSPAVAYDDKASVWLAVTLTSDCGGQGIGVMSSATPEDPAVPASWAAIPCAHSGTADDRPIIWVDNNSSSTFYGRRYISFNDFAAGKILKVVHSDGGNWTEVTVDGTTPLFIRNVHITGGSDSVSGNHTVFIFGMDENGGADANRSNWVYKSIDGGATWAPTLLPGANFPAPGAGLCAGSDYFNMIPPVWRHMGWGQGAVGPGGVVHYVYSREGQVPGDIGDIYYLRSPDNGGSWDAATPLNTDQAANNNVVQWQPAISVTSQGSVLATWYDKRNTTDGFNYEYYGRLSLDNGENFLPDEPISDLMVPQPTQVDANLPFCFAGDSNFHGVLDTATVNASLVTWTDGRNVVNDSVQDVEQMDVYFDRVPLCPEIDALPDALPNGVLGSLYTETLSASGGTPPYSFVLAGDLASLGLDLVGADITGTPSATGILGFSIVATDNFGCTASQEYDLIVDPVACPPITLTPATLPDAAQGAPYSEFVDASGSPGPFSYSVSSGELPSGLTLNSGTGEIAGVPAESGFYDVSITATDTSTQCTGTQSYTSGSSLSVDCPFISLSPASLDLPDMFAGVPYLTNITANGGTAPYKFKELGGTTHTNIFFGEGGTIFGVPESGGTKQPLFQAIDVNGCASSGLNEDAKFRMNSNNCFDGAILCDTLSNTTINFTTVDHCGGEAGWYGTNACPSSDDLGHDVAAHARWGTNDSVLGTEDCFEYGAGKTQDSFDSFTQDVSNCNSGEVILRFNYLLGFEEDHTKDRARVEVVADGGAPEVVADNGAGGPVCGGNASPGLRNLRPWSGWQHKEIIHPATSTFEVRFIGETDDGSMNAGEGFFIDDVNVQCKCADDQVMTPDTLAPTVVGSPYSVTFVTTGGVPPYGYKPPPGGGVPSGLVLDEDTGVLSGTPDTTGVHEFTVVSTDDNFCTVRTFFSLVVSETGCPAITLSPAFPALLDGQETVLYSDVVTATGGADPYTYSVTAGALPPGLSLDPDSGAISGTATTAGTYPFTVSALDFNLCAGSRDYTIVIAALVCPAIDITPEILPNASDAVPYSEQLIADGGEAPYTWLISTGTLPAGITLDASGLLSGTPTEDAAFLFAVTVQDANGCFADLGYNIDVLCTLDLVITSPTTISGLFQACNSITASGVQVVSPGATFRAGSLIVLGNDFSVDAATSFKAILDASLIPPP